MIKNKQVLEHFILMDENRMVLKDKYNTLVEKHNRLVNAHNELRGEHDIYKEALSADRLAMCSFFCNSFKAEPTQQNLHTKTILHKEIIDLWARHKENCKPVKEMEQKKRDAATPLPGSTVSAFDTTGTMGGGTVEITMGNMS